MANHDLLSGVGANILTDEIVQSVEKFICKAYKLSSDINTVNEARMVLFPTARKPEALPPTSEEGTFPNVSMDQCTPTMYKSSRSNRFRLEA